MRGWLIYGANGYTGRLVAGEAARRGLLPAVRALAAELGLPARVFSLDDREGLMAALEGIGLVLHCAGPFSSTSEPMLEACLSARAHYLDITGEISVFENAWRHDDRAKRSDVVLCPGAGFDVVPTDCLAARLVERLPSATSLQLAFEPSGGASPGTAKTSIEGLARGGMVRLGGELTRVPLAWKTREIPFRHARRTAVTIPWGDVFTTWVSTGVPDVEVYVSAPPSTITNLRRMRYIRPLLAVAPIQAMLKRRIGKSASGPSAETRARTRMQLWGQAGSADGRSVAATMETPNGYDLTVTAALGIVGHLLHNDVEGGYYTPSLLMGAGYAESLPGVSLEFN